MTRLIRAELLKLGTIRVAYVLAATIAALTGLFAVIECTQAGKGSGTYAVASLSTVAGQTTVTTLTSWSMLFAGVLGILVTSGEFRQSTATATYLATPNRGRVLMAKLASAAVAGAIFGLIAAAVSTAIGLAFIAGPGHARLIGLGSIAGHAAGAMIGAALLAMVGAGIGSLIRSQLAGIIALFFWALVIESLIGGLFTSVRPYLPYTAATTLAGIKLGGAAFGPAYGVSGSAPLPFAATVGLLAGMAAALAIVAARTTLHRDIA